MEIPPHAKKVFSGIFTEVYHWDQKMFDGSIQTFEIIRQQDYVSIIVVIDGKIVICEEEMPYEGKFLNLPGGRIEVGEDFLSAAKRELLEETGYASHDWEFVHSFKPPFRNVIRGDLFVARNCSKIAEPNLDVGEKISIKLVDFDTFVSTACAFKFRNQSLCQYIFELKHTKKLPQLKKLIFKKEK